MDETTKKLIDTYKTQGPLTTGQIGDVISSTKVPTTINSSSLSQVGTPLSIPSTPVSTNAEGITGMSSALAETVKASELQQAADLKEQQALQAKNESKSGLLSKMQELIGVQQSRPELEQQAGLEKKTASYNTALTNLEASQRAQTNELRALDSANMTDAGRAAAQRDINRKYAFEQADYSLILSVAQRDLVSAQNMVDKKIELALEPIKTQLEFTKMFYEDNKADLTKEEERAFGLKVKELDREYETQKTLQESIGKLQLEAAKNSAPASVISAIGKAKNYQEAISNAGVYTVSPASISTQVVEVNGKKLLINSKTGETIKEFGADTPANDIQMVQAQSDISAISELANDKNIRSAVGPSFLGRLVGSGYDRATGGRQNFIAGVEQLRSQLNLDTLIKAKGQGATFGALSDQELKVLSSAGTKLGTWVMKDGDGNVKGYNASEKAFKAELDKINNFARLDYIRKGGVPEDVGGVLMTDGNYYVQNSDGSYTQLTTY